ncbi:conjugative relaxase domain-containing protein, TrwC/TraI family [Prauserella marina]|uniref:Conjugative relaxase domain-containing protein, TrwC/TraI family n=1 Tax=Prauserella marina TaxID=530584 RepID=A0A1G6NQ94_9PSEU|nr:MobF family relaxase [Prauserella marina]PWV82443.1 conjugative relaxase-like TrwC/TraI family protein [Prauserella marina]SDC69345.1 conjugative relaxase domain-containing protein, TrwC/TraI family [Prauserella marina]
MLTISTGYSVDYLTNEVAAGRENYYTGAVAAGEPPGRWYGAGAEKLGLTGLVDEQDMTALYERFVDPRDEFFRDPARWGGASTLGHTGRKYQSEEELYAAALEREPDASPERRAELRLDAGKRVRKNVPFLDATFSVQKSVTVLHTAFEAQQVAAEHAAEHAAAALNTAAPDEVAELERQRDEALWAAESWRAHRDAVEDAIWAGNRAALDYLSEHAGYSRIGHHGGAAGRFIDAHDFVVASFFQHDSRNHDPQLHIHNAILNRVEGADGQWRTLDSKAIHKFRAAAAAVAERTTEEHLAHALGVRFAARPDGKAREVVGISPEVMELFSSRRRAITARTRELVEAFETKFGREPNTLELDRLQRQATFATRNAKSHEGETVEARLERWDRQLRAEVAGGLAQVAKDVLHHSSEQAEPVAWAPNEVLATALADVQSKKAGWTSPDLTRAISDALPDQLGDLTGQDMARLLDTLTEQGLELAVPLDAERPGTAELPDELRLANGVSVYEAPGKRLYATPEHVHTERALVASTARAEAPALVASAIERFLTGIAESGIELGADQAAAVRGVLNSGASVESLVGPAGTGKSFVVGTLAKAWQDPTLWEGRQRTVVGLASSQIATDVLAGEGLTARNITQWLGAQRRLADGGRALDDVQWQLAAGDLVVVDESAMANTADLAAIHQHVTAAGAKLLLTGDHRQLAAVGAGGGMHLMADAGAAYELVEARRFAAEWERTASLRLRDGDETVLGDYHKHGRLLDGGTLEQAEASAARAWLADTLDGHRSLLIVDTNEQAARLSADLRAELVRLGKVAEQGVPLGLQGTYAGTGDLIQARLNGWDLAGYEGNRRGPINREQYRVLATRDDGGLVVAPILGRDSAGEQLGERMTLPGGYVAEHVALGYASTVHSGQGLTVDRSHTVITANTSAEALYVGMSRGRHGNTAHVTTRAVPVDAPDGAALDAVHRAPAAVLAGAFDTADPQQSALAAAIESTQETEAIRTPAELLADATELATAGRTARWLDQLVDTGHLTAEQRARIAVEDGGPTLSRLLRRAELAGHDPRQVLTDAVASHPLTGARQLTNVLHHRIATGTTLDPTGDSYTDWLPQVDDPQWRTYLQSLAGAADQRREGLAAEQAEQPDQWVVEAFGAPPEEPAAVDAWKAKVGIVAAHRELTGHDDPETALGAAPKAGQVETYASWRAAWRTLGRPESGRDELEMSDGQLLMRVRAHEREATWGPGYVADELAGTRQATETQRQAAAMRRAEAQAATEEAERERLTREADDAEALAEVLDQRARQLAEADDVRALWLAHTAETRAAADRANAELSARHVDDTEPEPVVTAEEWLAAHAEDTQIEDQHREVTDEQDLAEVTEQRSADVAAIEQEPHPDAAETEVADLRDSAVNEEVPEHHDAVRVPTAEETADTVARAQRALLEIEQRQQLDQQHAAELAVSAELARRHAEDGAVEQQAAEDDAALMR